MRLATYVGEGAIAVVMKQMVALPGQTPWPAKNIKPAKLAGAFRDAVLARERWFIQIELCVAWNKKIESAITVVVAPSRTGRPATECDSGCFGDVGEGSVMIVVVQPVLTEVRDVNVGPAIVIVICDCH